MAPVKLASNIIAGIVLAILNITVAISVAAMIFISTPDEFLTVAVAVLLIGTIIIGLTGTVFSGFNGVICGARVAFAPVIGGMIGGIYGAIDSQAPEHVLLTIIVAIMMTSVLTGILLVLLG